MPTSESYPCRRSRVRGAGFTLLELLVVLAITAMLAGLIGPPFIRQIELRQVEGERMQLEIELSALAARVQAAGNVYVLDQGALERPLGEYARPVDVPPRWSLKVIEPIHFGALGACTGGRVSGLGPQGQLHEWRFDPPFCLPIRDPSSSRP